MSEPDLLDCTNCGAPLSGGEMAADAVVVCEYCRFGQRLSGEPRPVVADGPRLAENISLEVQPDFGVVLVERGAVLPTAHTLLTSTARDEQESMDFKFRAGDGEQPTDNRMLASFRFELRDPGPRGVAQIGLTIAIDAEGKTVVSVTEAGQDNRLSQEAQVAIEAAS